MAQGDRIVKNINLLPAELQHGFFKRVLYYQESHPREFITYIGSVILSGMILISLTQFILTKSHIAKSGAAEKAVYKLQARHKELTGLMNKLSQLRQALVFNTALLKSRAAFLKAQYNYGHNWPLLLRNLRQLVPKGVWLIGGRTEDYYLKISGAALDEKHVSEFMTALRRSPIFSNINFNYTQSSQVGNTKVIFFELTCNYDLQVASNVKN